MNGIPTLADQIKNGIQSFDDYSELSLMEELPDWVTDIHAALNDGNITPLLDKKYEPWVMGVYNAKKETWKPTKSDTVK